MDAADAALKRPPARAATHPRRRLALAIAVAGAFVVLVCYAGLGVYGDTQIVHQPRTPVRLDPRTIAPQFEDVSFASRGDRLTLRGWWFPGTPGGRAIVLVHGRGQNRADTDYGLTDIARAMHDRGYAVLTFDLRAHGASAGGVQSYGLHENDDVLGARDLVLGKGYAPDQIAIIGVSYGAAAMLLAAPQLQGIGALVADSTYAAAWPVITRQIRQQRPELAWLHPDFAVRLAIRLMDGVDLASVKPIDAVRKAPNTPILFIHGTADDYVLPKNSEGLRAASANPASELWLIPGATHGQTFKHDPAAWLARVTAYLDAHLH
ncbi:MAG TPA: alpha/beta hydrolase [Dehalococcoidia bacterium]|nr:alpha/beta hydrolase [Dehalococcoidia bacterium]